jgi:integrase
MLGQISTSLRSQARAPVTVLGLKGLKQADDGRTISMGESMIGKVRVGKDGTVSLHVTWRYRFKGKSREIRLGTWRDGNGTSLKALREERDAFATLLKTGIDPIEHKANERLRLEAEKAERERAVHAAAEAAEQAELERQRRLTVEQLFARWRQTELQPRQRSDGRRMGRKDGGQYVYEQFTRHVFPFVGTTKLEDLRKADLLTILDAQVSAGKLRTANVLLADMKQMLDFALERELIPANPLATVKKSKIGGANVERERVLSEEELKHLSGQVPSAGMHVRSESALWLTLATAVRVGELMGAVWSDTLPIHPRHRAVRLEELSNYATASGVKLGIVDLESRQWYLPDTKNQRDHRIHLSDFALMQLVTLQKLREPLRDATDGSLSPWVFPATDNRRPVCVKSFGKQLADRQRPPEARLKNRSKATTSLSLPGGKWTPHDLRRTAATLMARLGFGTDVINECLNHVLQDRMAKVYIRDRREADQAKAFDALGAKLENLTSTK